MMAADFELWSPSNCCSKPEVTHLDLHYHNLVLNICNLPLVPSWLLAVVLGIYFGCRFLGLGDHVRGSLFYSLTFFLYAVTVTSGLIIHCLFLVECGAQPVSQYFVDAGKVDASLTSCIAVSFAFCGLVDLKLLPDRSFITIMTMLSMYGVIVYAYFSGMANTLNLYFNSILLGCSLYMLTQLIYLGLHWSRTDRLAVLYYCGAGLVGGGSLFAIRMEYCLLCKTLGPWSMKGVWYYGSDIFMLLLGVYILKSRVPMEAVSRAKKDFT